MPRIQHAPRPTTNAVSRGTAPQRVFNSFAQQLALFLLLTPFILFLSKMLLECKKLPHLGDTESHGGFGCYGNLGFFSYKIHPRKGDQWSNQYPCTSVNGQVGELTHEFSITLQQFCSQTAGGTWFIRGAGEQRQNLEAI